MELNHFSKAEIHTASSTAAQTLPILGLDYPPIWGLHSVADKYIVKRSIAE